MAKQSTLSEKDTFGTYHLSLRLIESQLKRVKKCRDQLDGGVHIERVDFTFPQYPLQY